MSNTEIIYVCKVCGKEITDEELESLIEMGESIDDESEIECPECILF
jgi:DNA-directed RNA polymerase subunit RPC12/RpoP